ncbi:MAG: ExbD/TolR family protein [Gammaproteobacteria bacterium]
MAAEVKGDSEPYDDINITPMVDLTFVLLLIFIIMTTASVQGIQVNLPQASNAPSLAEPKTKAVTITAEGSIYLDTYPVTLQELESRLASFYAADPELPVVIKGDATVQYQLVMDVLDLVGRVGITQIGLVTQKIVK